MQISFSPYYTKNVARDSVTGWTAWGSNPDGSEIFRNRPDRSWGPIRPPVQTVPGLFPGGGFDHPFPPTADVKERVEQ
jgi:hypothetical protein